jgi:hypothetical protein
MSETSYGSSELAEWERLVNVLCSGRRDDYADVRQAQEATANLCSAWGGWMDMPEAIANIVQHAIETGYLAALADVREGNVGGLGPVDGN